jgi:sugar-specific transcriptional regulator TrmB
MKSLIYQLTELGLSVHASTLYLFLLEHGSKTPAELVRALDLYRPQVYRAIAELDNHNLVSTLHTGKQNKSKKYQALSPEHLQLFTDRLANRINAIIPALETRAQKKSNQPVVTTLLGISGIRATFDDVINSCKKGEVFYRYTSELDLDRVNEMLSKNYRAHRDSKKLERFVISNHLSGDQKRNRLERTIKFLGKKDPFNQNVIQLIYANKVATIDLSTNTSIVIENDRIAEFHKTLFKSLYREL